MKFTKIDLETWDRKECYQHFMTVAKSTYSITVNVDITKLYHLVKKKGYRFYPTFTWIVTKAINNHNEFKMGYDKDKNLGYYDSIYPDYAVLNEKTKIMDSLCTPFDSDFKAFYSAMTHDMDEYKEQQTMTERYPNFFVVSCLPWLTYTSFTASNESDYQFLFPMVTWGKYFEQNGVILMPLTLQIHHAVADGYHCSLFYKDVEEYLGDPAKYMK